MHGTIAADKPSATAETYPFGGLKGLFARRIRNNDARDGGGKQWRWID